MKIKIYFTEIYYRVTVLFFTWVLNFITLFTYKEQIVYMLGQHQQNLFPYFISTNLTETLMVFFKLSLFLAFYFSYPIVLVQIALFLLPGLHKYEYITIRNFLFVSIFSYIITTYLTYQIFLPYCWKFFNSFQLKAEESLVSIHLETRIADYLSFFLESFLVLNLAFHIFLIFVFLLHRVRLNFIIEQRKLFYLFFFIFATIVTPPDIISQILVGTSFLLTFEIFLFSLFISKEYKEGE